MKTVNLISDETLSIFTPLESPTDCSEDEDEIPFGGTTELKPRVSLPPLEGQRSSNGAYGCETTPWLSHQNISYRGFRHFL